MNLEQIIRERFAEYYGAEPPWVCWFCEDEIWEQGQSRWSLHRHHRDGDRTNNERSNLVPMHSSCHSAWHYLRTGGQLNGYWTPAGRRVGDTLDRPLTEASGLGQAVSGSDFTC